MIILVRTFFSFCRDKFLIILKILCTLPMLQNMINFENIIPRDTVSVISMLTLTKPLRQFHDLQRNIHRLMAKTFDLVVEPIKKEIKFRTIRPRSSIVDATTSNCVSSDFAACQ